MKSQGSQTQSRTMQYLSQQPAANTACWKICRELHQRSIMSGKETQNSSAVQWRKRKANEWGVEAGVTDVSKRSNVTFPHTHWSQDFRGEAPGRSPKDWHLPGASGGKVKAEHWKVFRSFAKWGELHPQDIYFWHEKGWFSSLQEVALRCFHPWRSSRSRWIKHWVIWFDQVRLTLCGWGGWIWDLLRSLLPGSSYNPMSWCSKLLSRFKLLPSLPDLPPILSHLVLSYSTSTYHLGLLLWTPTGIQPPPDLSLCLSHQHITEFQKSGLC